MSGLLCYFVYIWIAWTPASRVGGGDCLSDTSTADISFSRAQAVKAGTAGLKAFAQIAELWHLSISDQLTLLGLSSRSTYFKWKKDDEVNLPRDTLERLSYLLGIYKSLQILLPDATAADGWLRRPNAEPLFGGRSALERMLSGNVADLYLVRQYLDSQRG